MYIALDAGGSKCSAVLFDERFILRGRGLSGGVNPTQNSPEACRANVAECLDQLFSQACPSIIDALYYVFVGPADVLREEVRKRTRTRRETAISEPVGGLLAGALCKQGMLAVAGTGSDVFLVSDAPTRLSHRNLVGAWGPILGDDGSGTWIGQQALRAVVRAEEGWAAPTSIRSLLMEAWTLPDALAMVNRIHQSAAPFREVASVCPLVGQAAAMGDEVALAIVREAGALMAKQALCLIRREDVPEEQREIVCCGGAWKTHPAMYGAFCEALEAASLGARARKPLFEHVMAGVVLEMMRCGIPEDRLRLLLSENFPDYEIHW